MPPRVGAKSFEPPCAAAVKRKGAAVKRALTPGTFDPITAGHLDVISRAAQLVDEVIVAVAVSAKKKPLFSLEERVALVKEVTRDLPNVRVEPFDELLVDFARRMGAQAVVKGLRAITDFEYEFQMTAMQVHVIHEIDCSVERIDPAVVEAFLDAELSDDPMLADSICAMADAMSAELHPRGVYKLFNPAICTLPPKYTEPAIKLVGTLAVLYGSAAYERMSEAEHTAMVVSTVGTDEEIARLRERLVKSDMDALLFDACLEAMASLAADKLAEAVADDAHERGLHRGSTLETGVEDFPLTMNTTLAFFTQTEKRLGLTAAEDGTPSDRWSTWGVIGLYNETQKKRRGCAYCHNVRTCTIRKIGMTCHGRRTRKKAKPTPSADQQ